VLKLKYINKIENYLKNSGGIITSAYCRENGIPTVYLTRLVKSGKLERVDTGIYVTENGDYDELYFFQYKYKNTIYSYETAMYLLGITDKIIQVKDVTVSASYKFNNQPTDIQVHYVKKDIFELGVENAKTMFGNPVRVYSYERIICDFILNKEYMDPESYTKLLREYKNYKNKDIHNLYKIADKMDITDKVREIMEVIYE